MPRWLGPLTDSSITERFEKSAKNSLYVSQNNSINIRYHAVIILSLYQRSGSFHTIVIIINKVPICVITMRNAGSLAVALAAAFLSESTFALINNPMKPPNERFVLNAQQALIAVEAASAKAAANKYMQTIP